MLVFYFNAILNFTHTDIFYFLYFYPSLCFPYRIAFSNKEHKDGLTRYNRAVCHATEKCKAHTKSRRRSLQTDYGNAYDTYFPGAEALRPGPKSRCPDTDILTIYWLLELIGKDSECTGYKLVKAQLSDLFPFLPERPRFNRKRRNLSHASEKLGQVLIYFYPTMRYS